MRRWDSGKERMLTDGQLTELGGTWSWAAPGATSGWVEEGTGEDDGGQVEEGGEGGGQVEASLWEVGLAALWEAEAAGSGTGTHHR